MDVVTTLYGRCYDVKTLKQRPYNVVLTSCARNPSPETLFSDISRNKIKLAGGRKEKKNKINVTNECSVRSQIWKAFLSDFLKKHMFYP